RRDDDLAATVLGVAPALDEAGLFHLVKQADELTAVVIEGVRDRALRLALALGERREDRVVVRMDAGVGVGALRLLLRLHAEALDQKDRGGEELFRNAIFHDVEKCSGDYG